MDTSNKCDLYSSDFKGNNNNIPQWQNHRSEIYARAKGQDIHNIAQRAAVSSNSEMTVDITLENKKVRALVDTGSHISLIQTKRNFSIISEYQNIRT